jgi:hypothetical protein
MTLEHDPESQRCQVWHCLDVPGYGLGGFLGYYWTVDADIDRWNGELFRSQAATMTELTGVLMTSDLAAIAPRQVEPGCFLRQTMSGHNGAFRSEAILTMTTLLNRALIPTMLDQQIDLSTPVIGATIDVDLAKAFSAPAEELEKLTQQLYTTLIDTAGCTG